MDVNDLRIAVTVVSLLVFLGLMVWVSLRRNAPRFEEAALIPFTAEGEEVAP